MSKNIRKTKTRAAKGLLAALFSCSAIIGYGTYDALVDYNIEEAQEYSAHIDTPDLNCLSTIRQELKGDQYINNDHHDVLVIPGFFTNDAYMYRLHTNLSEAGFSPHNWEGGILGLNSADDATQLEYRLIDIYENNEQQKISIVGYSLGGVHARALAMKHPDKVRTVITLSSPLGLKDDFGNLDARVQEVYNSYDVKAEKMGLDPIDVPVTAFSSTTDRIVSWKHSVIGSSDNAENGLLTSGHIAIPFRKETSQYIAERLSTSFNNWQTQRQKYCLPPKRPSPNT